MGVLGSGRMDLSTLPTAFLEAYPYPVFVLAVPVPSIEETDENDYIEDDIEAAQNRSLPFTRSASAHWNPFTPVWSNAKWSNLSQNQSLLECMDMNGIREFGNWISGARAANKDKRDPSTDAAVATFIEQGGSTSSRRALQSLSAPNTASASGSRATNISATNISGKGDLAPVIATDFITVPTVAKTAENNKQASPHSQAPEGFWEPENPPYEDRSVSDPGSHSDNGTGIGAMDGEYLGPSTLTVHLVNPARVTLEMTKSTMPIYHSTQHLGKANKMATHTFAIITTTPRSPLIVNDTPSAAAPITSASQQQPSGTVNSSAGSMLHGESSDPVIAPSAPRKHILPDPSSPIRTLNAVLPRAATLDPNPTPALPGVGGTGDSDDNDAMAIDTPTGEVQPTPQSGGTLLFNRDGTVTRQRSVFPAGSVLDGRSMDVHVLMETTDWSKTSLGPKESWPQSLKSAASLVMQYPHQCCLWWGKDLTLIYNGPYSETIHKHPHLFGMSGPVAWSEIWNQIGPLSELVLSGTSVYKEDDLLLMKPLPHQGNKLFEAYHSWMWVPIKQEDGTNGGLWNATINTTKKVLAERRLNTVREMGERTSIARTLKEFDSAVIEILAANPRDIPFAALYHVENVSDKGEKRTSTTTTGVVSTAGPKVVDPHNPTKLRLRLAGAIGVPENHPSTPKTLTINYQNKLKESRNTNGPFAHGLNSPTLSIMSTLSGNHRASTPTSGAEEAGASGIDDQWPLKDALQTRRLIMVDQCEKLIAGFPLRVWDDLPNSAVVVPIANDSDGDAPGAILVIGLSIMRPFDEEYESFIHVLRLHLASGLAAVKSYEAERQRIEELAALDRAKSMLFSNISHELRTPLTLVAGPLDDLYHEMPDGPKRENLVMARRNVRRLTRLVSTLMDVSRLEAGKLRGSFRLVNLGLVTRDLCALFRGAIERVRLRFIVEADVIARNTFVDPDHWEKIVFNLIGNAMKYTMSGFVHVRLAYYPEDRPTEVVLSVKDSGVGIPSSDISLVGERFHRVESVSRSHEGTGIGLSFVKELIKLHGGTLTVESVTAAESTDGSHGSVFSVRIPLGADHLPRGALELPSQGTIDELGNNSYGKGIVDEALLWSRDKEASSADSSSDSGGTNSLETASKSSSRGLDPSTLYFQKTDTILLVDDSFDTRRYMKSIFAPFCTVVEAKDGREALDIIEKSIPDLVVTDVMMPVMDGFGLLAKLKEQKKFSMIPVIMLTAKGGDEAKVEGLLAGADDYLGKPFNARELIARTHMQLQLGKKRKALEEAFDARTAELRTLSEYSPVGIFRCAEDGSMTFANNAWHEMSGYPRGVDVTNWGDYIDPLHRNAVQKFWESIHAEDQAMLDAEWKFDNGRWVTVKIIRLDLVVGKGLSGILGTVNDITERKINEEIQRQQVIEAEQRRIEAEEAKRQQELLIDITSHEIRNPISSLMQIIVKTNLISLQEQLEATVANQTPFKPTKQLLTTIDEDLDALESIYQCGLAQERISNDVLSLGRIQLDMLQIYDVEMDIREEAQKVISIFQNEARMKRINLSLNIGESVDRVGVHFIKTDPVRLGQVFTNLLSNGIRFTSTSEIRRIELSINLSLDPPADDTCAMPPSSSAPPSALKDDMDCYLYVAVNDTGPGLTRKELDMLFQRFSQVSPKTHTVFGGSGLGLFVCRKITELMGGRIEVTSEYGKGSTFRFFIKARTAQTSQRSPNARDKDTGKSGRPPLKKRRSAKTHVARVPGPGPKPHVLIVEDNLINQTVLMRQLKHVGFTCDVANNGLEALEKIRKVSTLVPPGTAQGQVYDCVVMDLEMPVMDGLTAVRHVRAEEAAGSLSRNLVIALTGNARQGQIDEAKAAGMDDVVIKPYRLDDLLQKIEELSQVREAKPAPASAPTEDDGMQGVVG